MFCVAVEARSGQWEVSFSTLYIFFTLEKQANDEELATGDEG